MENFQIQNCLIKLNEKLDILHHAKLSRQTNLMKNYLKTIR
jgi:hypothetical protein